MKTFPIKLSLVIGSHLSDAMFVMDTHPASAHNHIYFVKILTFLNPNLENEVTTEYCDLVWNAVVQGELSEVKSFEKFKGE